MYQAFITLQPEHLAESLVKTKTCVLLKAAGSLLEVVEHLTSNLLLMLRYFVRMELAGQLPASPLYSS